MTSRWKAEERGVMTVAAFLPDDIFDGCIDRRYIGSMTSLEWIRI